MATNLRSSKPLSWKPLLDQLDSFYSHGKWRVPVLRVRGVDPYRVLVSTILSHRTRDEVTERASLRLLKAYPSARDLADARISDIRRAIYDAGLSKYKAKGLRDSARVIVTSHYGIVPKSERELMALPLVGKKTASAILVFGHEQAAIPVDTHIHRVVNRLGVVRTNTLEKTSVALSKVVPRAQWSRLNPTIVQHGQNICRAVRPLCTECPISGFCSRVGVPGQA